MVFLKYLTQNRILQSYSLQEHIMSDINNNSPILVTGATGYIAGWIIKDLLEQGHTVHATVRSPEKKQTYQHLTRIAEQSLGELKVFAADLLKDQSFDEAMQNCEIVIHTASPFVVTNFKDAYEDLVKPAVQGTRNVLNSANRIKSVKKVILTSSIASTYGDAVEIEKTNKGYFDEDDWNTTSSVNHQPYPYSKVAAEREAWKMQSEQSRWQLVCINPALVMGPSLTPNSKSGSIEVLQQFGTGMTLIGVPPMWMGFVDVRDVAQAHLKAAFNPHARGRYIICAETLSLMEIGNILKKHFGKKYPFPKLILPKAMVSLVGPLLGYTKKYIQLNMGYPIYFNHQRSIDELHLNYIPMQQSLTEHFQQLIDDGLVKNRS